MDPPNTISVRFWSKVDRGDGGECWEFTGSTGRGGYGRIKVGGRLLQAHRVAYSLAYGPPDNPLVLHKCDNRSCVNPNHLYAGTYSDNLRDAYERGRREEPKLTPREVELIRRSEDSDTETARRFGVSRSHVANIRAGRRRKSTPGETE